MGPGLLFLLTGLVLGHRPHPHRQRQFGMASKTHLVKMSGKADSTSIRFLICRLQSHMYQRPRRTPANWPEMKAGVDPTEEKGAPHPFLPSRGDLCLLFSTQAPKLLVLLLFECTPLPFLCPSQRWKVGRTEAEVGFCAFGGGGKGTRKGAPSCLFVLYIFLSYCLRQLHPAGAGCWDR